MRQRYEHYTISDNKVDLEDGFVNEDFKGDWDLHREMFKKKRDEEGVNFYSFKEEENRMEFTYLNPEGYGGKTIISRVEENYPTGGTTETHKSVEVE